MKSRKRAENRVEGSARVLRGRVKKVAGALTGDQQLEREGKVEEFAGRVQKKAGQVERILED